MRKTLVLSVIAKEIQNLFDSTCKWDKSGPAYGMVSRDILDLCEAYFELRGHKGMAVYIDGMDNEVCSVASIKQIVEER